MRRYESVLRCESMKGILNEIVIQAQEEQRLKMEHRSTKRVTDKLNTAIEVALSYMSKQNYKA